MAKNRRQENSREKKRPAGGRFTRRQKTAALLFVDAALLLAILITGGLLAARWYREKNRPELSLLRAPDWYTQDFLQRNPYSRPGIKRDKINSIVIHYVANPGTTALQNRAYFDNLANQTGENATSASSHYIIGIDGEIVQCIPLDEVAYANYPRNDDTVSVECCHPDNTGEFSGETVKSLERLVGWLCAELNLNERDVIRHYDVSGKNCPKYYVEHEDAWQALRKAMKPEIRAAKAAKAAQEKQEEES